ALHNQLVGGDERGAVPAAARQYFTAEPAVLIHFEHVYRDVSRLEALNPVERLPPALPGLARQTRDPVDVEIAKAARAQGAGVRRDSLGAVFPAGSRQFRRNERLHAQ